MLSPPVVGLVRCSWPEKTVKLRTRLVLADLERERPWPVTPLSNLGSDTMDKDRIAGATKDFAGKIEGAAGSFAGDGKTEASGRAREAAGTVQNLYGQAKDAARDVGEAAANMAKDAYDNSGDTFRDGTKAVAKTVQDNPLGSLLLAGGIGFALALMLTRQPRRPPQRWRYYG
jgi:uncharacterized protein YjbJ (UPF0337 family)